MFVDYIIEQIFGSVKNNCSKLGRNLITNFQAFVDEREEQLSLLQASDDLNDYSSPNSLKYNRGFCRKPFVM